MAFNLENYTWTDFETLLKRSKKTAIIPVGSIEQHGYHLPIGTDSFVAQTLAKDASEKTESILVPPIWFGWSPHHMVLPGTITIRTEILIDLLYDVIDSLAKHGVKNFVLINGHRIVNVIWMQIASQKIQEKHDIEIVIFDPAYMSKEITESLGFGAVGHGEEIETSHMLHINEELVKMDKAVDNPIKDNPLYSVDPNYRKDTLCYVPTTYKKAKQSYHEFGGVHGEPSKSSKEKGTAYHNHLMENLIEVINRLQSKEV